MADQAQSPLELEDVEFNPFLPEVHTDPYPTYRRLRERDPVHWNPLGAWIVTRYADVVSVLRDPRASVDSRNSDLYRAFRAANPGPDPFFDDAAPSMLFVDPPDHSRLRNLVSKAFTARVIDRMRPQVQAIVDAELDRVAGGGAMDVVADLAYPVPVTVICQTLGIPQADHHLFHEWSQELVHLLDPMVGPDVLNRALEARTRFREYFLDLIAERRRHPTEDLLSGLIAAEQEGERLSQEELLSTLILLLVAGHETTVNLISNGTLALLRNPGELRRLREDPALIRVGIEELLRYDSPVQLTGRVAMKGLELGDKRIAPGQQLVLVLGAANRDPAEFPDPDRLDVGRENNRHVAFSGGAHFCLGAPLARLEGGLAIGAMLRRLPRLELEAEEPHMRDTITLRGLKSLPVRF